MDKQKIKKKPIKKAVEPIAQVKNKEGRPTKYKPEYCDSIIEYMSREVHEIVVDKKYFKNTQNESENGGIRSEDNKLLTRTFPTFERWCHTIGIHKDTMYAWATVYPEFSDSLRRAKQIQEAILIENGMVGQYNSPFAMFMAKNNFGYKDKVETDITSGGEKLSLDFSNASMKQLEERIKQLLNQ